MRFTLWTALTCAVSVLAGALDSPETRQLDSFAAGNVERGPTTNGERLRRGLPLLPPTRRDRQRRQSTQAPCSENPQIAGHIAIHSGTDGSFQGYLRKQTEKGFVYWGPIEYAQNFTIPRADCRPANGYMDITTVGTVDPVNPYLGAAGGSAGYEFRPGKLGYAFLTQTQHLDSMTPASFAITHSLQGTDPAVPAVSMIWRLRVDTTLIPTWTNVPDAGGNSVQASLLWHAIQGYVMLTGDLLKLQNSFPADSNNFKLAFFKWVPT